MRYVIDHDLHIHTHISPCSNNPAQCPERILQYAKDHNLKHVCTTDHFWDELVEGNFGWPGYSRLSENLPLPQHDGIQFHFGCEADMNSIHTVGISRQTAEKFDFIIVPTTHMHLVGATITPEDSKSKQTRIELFVKRWEKLLEADLPFNKIGLAHITWGVGIAGELPWEEHFDILDSISDDTFKRLFSRSEQLGMGIELNFGPDEYTPDQLERILRVYRLAAECGCHFYFGSDAHHPGAFDTCCDRFEKTVDLLGLQEDQKFNPFK